MSKDNVLALRNPGIASEVSDVLTQVLRAGAQQMLARAIEAEVAILISNASHVSRTSSRIRSATSPVSTLYRYFVTHTKWYSI